MLSLFKKKPSNLPEKKVKVPIDGYAFLSAEELLKPHKLFINNIRLNSGASKDFFDVYYLPCLHNFAELIQLRPYGQEGEYRHVGGALEAAIKRVAMALKLILGKLFPRNTASEEVAERQECWTYGAFITALLREMGGQILNVRLVGFDKKHHQQREWNGWLEPLNTYAYYKMEIDQNVNRTLSRTLSIVHMRSIVPEQGMVWLQNDKQLMLDMMDELSGMKLDPENMIFDLISSATSKALNNTRLTFRQPDVRTVKERVDKSTGEVIVEHENLSHYDAPFAPIYEDAPSPSTPPIKQAIPTPSVSKPAQEQIPPPEKSERKDKPVIKEEKPPIIKPPEVVSATPEKEEKEEDVPNVVMEFEPSETEEKQEASLEVNADTFASIVQADIEHGLINDNSIVMKDQRILVKYPLAFKLYTDSPSELLGELQLKGKVIEEIKATGKDRNRTIVLKAN